MTKAPPPPEIGDKFWGPGRTIEHKRTTHEVRAIVDPIAQEHPEYGYYYYLVFRYWHMRKKRYEYIVAHAVEIGMGRYTPVRKRHKSVAAS